MPEDNGSQLLFDIKFLPQRTAIIIGAEMYYFNTGKGFSYPFQVVFGLFLKIFKSSMT